MIAPEEVDIGGRHPKRTEDARTSELPPYGEIIHVLKVLKNGRCKGWSGRVLRPEVIVRGRDCGRSVSRISLYNPNPFTVPDPFTVEAKWRQSLQASGDFL